MRLEISQVIALLLKSSFYRHKTEFISSNNKPVNNINDISAAMLWKWFWQDYKSAVLIGLFIGGVVFSTFYFFFYVPMEFGDSIIIGIFAFLVSFILAAKGTYDKYKKQVEESVYKSESPQKLTFIDKYVKVLNIILWILVFGSMMLAIMYALFSL